MSKTMKNYCHVIEVNEETRVLQIYRLYPDNSRVLYTETELPKMTFDEDEVGFREFAKTLGENLLTDSPIARKIIGIN